MKFLKYGLIALGFFVVSPVMAQQTLTPAQRTEVEAIVRETLRNNPQILYEAIEALRNQQAAAKESEVKKALSSQQDKIFRSPDDEVAGNPSGDVTVVEFFDYRCGYCKKFHITRQALLAGDPNIRYVHKEFPVLGPESELAARAAIASRAQGKYLAFHEALMAHRGSYAKVAILEIAKETGLDPQKLEAAMFEPNVDRILAENRALADSLQIRGTPGFVVGDQIIPGAIELEEMLEVIHQIRKG